MSSRRKGRSSVLGRVTLGALLGTALGTASAAAADWYVDASYYDCANADGSAAKPFCTVNEAVNVAAAGDTIHIAPGSYSETIAPSVDLQFLGTNGASVTIFDLGTNSLDFTDVTVEITGIEISNRNASSGSAIRVLRGDVTLSDCVVKNCTSSGWVALGAGINADQSTVKLVRCTLQNNVTKGIASSSGGALYLYRSRVTMDRCLVVGNGASRGGAIASGDTQLEVWDSELRENWASDGGTVDLNSSSTAVVRHCTFVGNQSFSTIDAGDAVLEISDSHFEDNTSAYGGAIRIFCCDNAIERCVFRGNRALIHYFSPYGCCGEGGAVYGPDVHLADCLFESNFSEVSAGGAYVSGASTVERCRFVGNSVFGNGWATHGGGIVASGTSVLRDCEFVGNVAESTGGTAGQGGGASVDGGSVSIERCSLGDNSAIGAGATSGGLGGGLWVDPSASVALSHVVLAENFAELGGPDLSGTATTLGYNVLGDSSGATLSGGGTNDLLDVDPLFTDAANGDLSLLPGSPCIDSGDPAYPAGGKDAAQAPRVLDGDLDRSMLLDRGAREYGHVRLDITGAFVPGGAIQVDTTGTAGLPVCLFAGHATTDLVVAPFGSLFVDLSQVHLFLVWGTIPNVVNATIPLNVPVPVTLYVQEVAFAPVGGNFSNLVRFDVR